MTFLQVFAFHNLGNVEKRVSSTNVTTKTHYIQILQGHDGTQGPPGPAGGEKGAIGEQGPIGYVPSEQLFNAITRKVDEIIFYTINFKF